MLVTSFFPGRIRLRAPIFKDAELYQKARTLLERLNESTKSADGAGAIKSIEYNPVTGSVLLLYEPKKIPTEKLMRMQDFFTKLEAEAERFSSANREKILSMLSEFENSL